MSNQIAQDATNAVPCKLARSLSPQAQKELAVMANDKNSVAAATTTTTPEPSKQDLRLVALNQAIPFIGFGIMDNAILIVAGDAIDMTVGITLGISTLCAAAIGNIISDVAGVMLGTVIEDCTARLGLPVANLSTAQRRLRSVRFSGQLGCAVGLTIGCIIGMFPLLFMDTKKGCRLKQEARMDSLFEDVVSEAKGLVGAEFTSLFVVVDSETSTIPSSISITNHTTGQERKLGKNGNYLYAKYITSTNNKEQTVFEGGHIRSNFGIVGQAVLTGKSIALRDAQKDPHYQRSIEGKTGRSQWTKRVEALICVPVFDYQGNVVAVIEACNKVGAACFSEEDVKVLEALATHVSVSLQNMKGEETENRLKHTIAMIKDQGKAQQQQQLA